MTNGLIDETVLFETIKKIVNSSVSNYSRLSCEREDLYSEVFMAVWSALDKYDPQKAQLNTYINMVAKSKLNTFLKKHSRKETFLEDLAPADEDMNIEDVIPGQEDSSETSALSSVGISKFLEYFDTIALRSKLRNAGNLKFILKRTMEGVPVPEIADELEMSRTSVYHALKKVSTLLDEKVVRSLLE